MINEVARAHTPLFSDEKEGLMLVGLHFFSDFQRDGLHHIPACAPLSPTTFLSVIL